MNRYGQFKFTVLFILLFNGGGEAIAAKKNALDVKAITWSTMHEPMEFPEVSGSTKIEHLVQNPNSFGIAISGGGTRSAAAAIGQLRAMKSEGWLSQAKYISASSGGAWALTPYLYKPDSISDEIFLGSYTPPEKLTEELIRHAGGDNSLANIIHSIGFIGSNAFTQAWRGNEAYGNVIAKNFLEPLSIKYRRFFSFDEVSSKVVLQTQNEKVRQLGFSVMNSKRKLPYPIITATAYPRNRGKWGDIYPVEITPLYTGIRTCSKESSIGGGYIESFAYDAIARAEPFKVGKLIRYKIENKASRFSLADVVGVTGAAPVQLLESTRGLPNSSFPKFNYQPIPRDDCKGASAELNEECCSISADTFKDLSHGDGGLNDNLALFPLFNRKVENILVFVNTSTKFDIQTNEIKEQEDAKLFKKISGDLVSYFDVSENAVPKSYHPHRFPHNAVIREGKSKLAELISSFQASRKLDQPLVHCDKYSIQRSDRYGLKVIDDYNPNICWVYLDRSTEWIKQLNVGRSDKTMRRLVADKKCRGDKKKCWFDQRKQFKRFPHYKTLGEKKLRMIDLSASQVHALSQLTDWTVRTSNKKISESLGLDVNQ